MTKNQYKSIHLGAPIWISNYVEMYSIKTAESAKLTPYTVCKHSL